MAAPGVSPWGYHQCFAGVVTVLPPPQDGSTVAVGELTQLRPFAAGK
jgi:hypothetical protein